jgi:spore coat protein CotH
VQGDKDNDSLSLRNFSIIEEKRGKWRYFRIVITDEPSAVKLTIDSEKEYEYSNNVKIAFNGIIYQ